METIERKAPLVQMLSAAAKGKADGDALGRIREASMDMGKDIHNPQTRYLMAQLITYAAQELFAENTQYLREIADTKTIGGNDAAEFYTDYDEAFAVIQAENASTPRWQPARKSIVLDTFEIASRFRVSGYDLADGKADLGQLTLQAASRMEEALAGKIMEALAASYDGTNIASPFYGEGSGVVTTALDPIIRYYQRFGSVNLLGDIEILDKLASAGDKDWRSDDMKNEYNNLGYLGKYKGANAVVLANGYAKDGKTPIITPSLLFVVPNGEVSPLKLVIKGDMLNNSGEVLDTGHYEVSLRQRYGVGVVYGKVPMLGVYKNTGD